MIDGLSGKQKWIVFALLLLCHVYFFQTYPNYINTNEFSRLLLVSAIADDGTLQIDGALKRFGDNEDKAFYQGHFYSDKPPGTAILGVPVYWICKHLGFSFSAKQWLFVLRLFCITIPILLLFGFLTKMWRGMGFDALPALLVLGYLFGTIAFTYSTEFISHYACGVLLICSFYCIRESKYLIAGAFSGAAVLLEYPGVFAVLCLLVYAAIVSGPRKTLQFLLGCFPFAVAILVYQYAIFGNPFELTYRHMTNARQAEEYAQGGLGLGLRFPQTEAIWGLLFGMRRGLFFFCPILIPSIAGFYFMIRDPKYRKEGILFVAIIATAVLFYSCLQNWDGRWAFGPRYLSASVPFVMTGTVAFFALNERFRFLMLPLAVLSIAIVTVGTSTFPFPPEQFVNPMFTLHLPLAMRGAFGENIAAFLPLFGPLIGFYCFLVITAFVLQRKVAVIRTLIAIGFTVLILLIGSWISAPPTGFEYFARGSILYYLGKYDESVADLQQALASNPDDHLKLLIRSRLYQIQRKR